MFFAGFILFARNMGGLPGTLLCRRLCCGAGCPRETEMPQLRTWEPPGLAARSNVRAVSLCFPGWVIGEKKLVSRNFVLPVLLPGPGLSCGSCTVGTCRLPCRLL